MFQEEVETLYAVPSKMQALSARFVFSNHTSVFVVITQGPVHGSTSTTCIHSRRTFERPMGRRTDEEPLRFHDGGLRKDRSQGHGSPTRRWEGSGACLLGLVQTHNRRKEMRYYYTIL